MAGGVSVNPPKNYQSWAPIGKGISSSPAEYETSGAIVKIEYRSASAGNNQQKIFTANDLTIDLTPGYQESIVKGSVRFRLGSRTYVDRNGSLYFDISSTTGAGVFGGTISYTSGIANIIDWEPGSASTLSIESLLTEIKNYPVERMDFRIASAPVKTESLQIRVTPEDGGAEMTAVSNADQSITGAGIRGVIDYTTGLVSLNFGEYVVAAGQEGQDWYHADNVDGLNVWKPIPVMADTMTYNATSQTFLPLDPVILGLNPVRLPEDGRVPVYADGDVVVILHDEVTQGTYSNAQEVDLGRGRLSKVTVRDEADQMIDSELYTADLDVGIVTFIGDLTGISQPIKITSRIEDMSLVTDVQITGKLSLNHSLTHTFPANETLVSNALLFGDLYAHTSIPFDQQSWTNVWSDALIASETAAQFNNTQYPIVVDNDSVIEERWFVQFISSTAVNIIGEHVGQVLTGVSITGNIAPTNPNTAAPYFTIPSDGWGSGWSAGNILRFNTYSPKAPTWVIQSVQPSQPEDSTDEDYTFCLERRGDIDTP